MSVNKVILVGNVGSEPEVRYVSDNVPVANFNLATSERGYKNSRGEEVPERTEWHRIVLWRGLASTAEKYVHKGSQLYIEGRIQSRKWTDKEGNERTTVEILADTMQLLGRREGEVGEAYPAAASAPKATKSTAPEAPMPAADDDLPF